MQTAWDRLTQRYGSVKNRSMLFTTVRNAFYDQRRRAKIIAFEPLDSAPEPAATAPRSIRWRQPQGLAAAAALMILLVDADGRRCTLVVALAEDNRLARVRPDEYEREGVRVRIWHDAGRLFVMAV